jgi:hypothetical protein
MIQTNIMTLLIGWVVHNVEISFIAVIAKEYQITAIDNYDINVEVMTDVHVKIDLVIDDESYAYCDPDDKAFYYPYTFDWKLNNILRYPSQLFSM